jgi:diguanylate cyclase (GGDEF)-like protein
MLPTDIYHAFIKSPKTGKMHPAGRILSHDGQLHHLEDYYGLLKDVPEGHIDDLSMTKLHHPGNGVELASHGAIKGGHRLDVIPEAELDPMPEPQPTPTAPQLKAYTDVKPASVWHYTRAGHDQPHVLEAKEGKYLLDGNPLEDHEVATILDNVRSKAGKIRYVKGVGSQAQRKVIKMEMLFASLRKSDMDPDSALAHLDAIGGNGDKKTQDAIAALRRHVFEDQMVPGLGNKFAYQKFAEKNIPGTTVVGDANFFKGINDELGHEAGDAAIKAMGNAWRDAAAEVGQSKAHRFGGDEFHAHFPSYEHAANFARTLRAKLDQVPPVGGTRKLSMSLGIGHDFPSADKAVYQAKQQKGAHTPATIPSMLAHSLHRGYEGPMPLNADQLQLTPPPVEGVPAETGASAPVPPPRAS